MNSTLILFLGRSTEGIYTDAQRQLEGEWGSVVVVSRDGDRMEPPVSLADRVIPISEWAPEPGLSYTVVANGGTTAQLVPVLRGLVEQGSRFEVFDLQRDGSTRLW